MDTYDPHAIERKWQQVWEDARRLPTSRTRQPGARPAARRATSLEMLPYPSGTLHMGHVLVYTIGDVLARFQPAQRLARAAPDGFDSFGLPAENAAIREGGHPREIIERNIAHDHERDEADGLGLDWDRVIAAHEPEYYRWTQWLFLKLFEAGLAYRKAAPVKWCPNDQAVLANEQVHDGRCEYCGAEVDREEPRAVVLQDDRVRRRAARRPRRSIDWPDRIKAMQRNWIGRSEGRRDPVPDRGARRGRAGLHDAARHAVRRDVLRARAGASARRAAGRALAERATSCATTSASAAAKRGEERAAAEEKTGVFTGFFATNPVNEARIPIWVADYVLMDYGTGAIMAVPAHDERDCAVRASASTCRSSTVIDEDGESSSTPARVRLGAFPARARGEARDRRLARRARTRQAGDQLPPARLGLLAAALLGLPDPDRLLRRLRRRRRCPTTSCRCCCPTSRTTSRRGSRRSRAPRTGCTRRARRAARTGGARSRRWTPSSTRRGTSCATATRTTTEAPWDREIVDWWNPVDQYIGGVDHATMHLIYARFFMKALNDLGLIGFREPFLRLSRTAGCSSAARRCRSRRAT